MAIRLFIPKHDSVIKWTRNKRKWPVCKFQKRCTEHGQTLQNKKLPTLLDI